MRLGVIYNVSLSNTNYICIYLEEIALINTRQTAERIIILTQRVEQKHTHTVQPNLPVFLERASLAVFV